MIILEKPYISEFLQETVIQLQIPVLKTDFVLSLPLSEKMNLIEQDAFLLKLKQNPEQRIYSNSENSSVWLNNYAEDFAITKLVNTLKNKAHFRDLLAEDNTNFWYKVFTFNEIMNLNISEIPKGFVIKPKRGFASICIHAVFNNEDWENALNSIKKEAGEMKNVFPDNVVSLQEFIIEKFIEGKEIAIDAYFDENGCPVILNILTHLHTSKYDMSDRLYVTSETIITTYHQKIYDYLILLNKKLNVKNFPFHLEMIENLENEIVPIEINPMRFMGFCVADVDFLFYGINPYEYFFKNLKPDWNSIFKTRKNKIYGFVVVDIPKNLNRDKIKFNYEKFISHFSKPLHYVKMDYNIFPMAIFMFAEVADDNFKEFEYILHSDLMEYID